MVKTAYFIKLKRLTNALLKYIIIVWTKMMSGNILGFTFKKFHGLKRDEEIRQSENSYHNFDSLRKKHRESYVMELSKLLKNDGKETTVTDKVLLCFHFSFHYVKHIQKLRWLNISCDWSVFCELVLAQKV